jgi:hypothetical protein
MITMPQRHPNIPDVSFVAESSSRWLPLRAAHKGGKQSPRYHSGDCFGHFVPYSET